MKWHMSVKDLTTIAICIALAVVLGKGLGVIHRLLPGFRSIINAPVYSLLIALILYRVRKPGAMTLFAVGYGLIMLRISIFMTFSVIIGGVLADLIVLIVVRKYDSNMKIALCAPIYSVGGIIGTFIITTFFIKSSMYHFQGPIALVVSMVSVYFSGLLGSLLAMKIYQERLVHVD